ncbi:MAG TPA: hypothetical protein VM243_02350, partial [Phycisphaerae bacterium]|nr:hypothetical protein [Phycisphaerae bacterium]
TIAGGITTFDVTQWMAVYAAAVSTLEWYMRESGAATYAKAILTAPVLGSGSWNMGFGGQYASCSWNFRARFGAAASDFQDMLLYTDGEAAPTMAKATMLTRPLTAVHGALSVLHPVSLGFAANAQILSDAGDADIGETAVDRLPFGPLQVTLGFRGAGKQTGPPMHELVDALLDAARGDLVVTAEKSGGGSVTITAKNVQFLRDAGTYRYGGFTEHRVTGEMDWLDIDGETECDWTGASPIIAIA